MALSLLWYGLGCLGIGVVSALAVLRVPWCIYVSTAAGAVGCAVLASAAGVWLTGASVTARLANISGVRAPRKFAAVKSVLRENHRAVRVWV